MFSAFEAENIAVIGEGKSVHVVVVDCDGGDGVAFRFEKITSPIDITITAFVMKANSFTLRGDLRISLLLDTEIRYY